MPAEMDQILQMMQADPALGAAPPLPMAAPPGQGAPLVDPMMPPTPMAPFPGQGMGAIGAFPSTDPAALAQVVQEALATAASQDHQALELQQQQAALEAGPIIDQMMMQAAAPPAPMLPPAADPMMAFGEAAALPPLPPEGLSA